MKRPKWTLFWIGTIWLCSVTEVSSLKATALIFSKPTSTTTAETPASDNDDQTQAQNSTSNAAAASSTVSQNIQSDTNNTESKPQLTGIPQIDYIWDPNLPRELNGYNLTDYPFYASVPPPEEIDFKCDGLHDGFYASIPHKCQVYHHCLFGTRYDFLCANYTAFDQKTFICHFVSEVDCNNSAKYFHRNDALYKAASTTTTTLAPPPTQATVAPIPPSANAAPRNPYAPSGAGGGYRRRRPGGGHRRRRPQYEYYDDELDEYMDDYYDDEPVRGRGNRKRLRPRPRDPLYDEYEDEYDVKYDRRGSYDRRRPMGDRRRPYDDREYDEQDRRKPVDRRKMPPKDIDTDERRSFDDRRPPYADDYNRRPAYNERRKPAHRRPYDDRRYMDDEEMYDRRRPIGGDDEDVNDRRYKPSKETTAEAAEEPKAQIKPISSSSSSIYSKPRAPPIIRRPVPINERNKFDYTSTSHPGKNNPSSSSPVAPADYEDDYEYDQPSNKRKPATASTNRKPVLDVPPKYTNTRPRANGKRPVVNDETYDDDIKPRGNINGRRPATVNYRDEKDRSNQKRPSDLSSEDNIRSATKERRPYDEDIGYTDGRFKAGSKRGRPPLTDDDYEDERKILETTSRFRKPFRPSTTSKPRLYSPTRTTSTENVKKPEVLPDEEFYDETLLEYEQEYSSPSTTTTKRSENGKDKNLSPVTDKKGIITENRINTTRNENPLLTNKREPYVKIVKRPFLPSRGGNPLAARGLQPVGSRAQEISNKKIELPSTAPTTTTTTTTEKKIEEPTNSLGNYKINFKTRGRFSNPGVESDFNTNNAKYEYITDVSSTTKTHELAPIIPSEDSTLRPNSLSPTTPGNIRVNLRGNFNVGSGRNFGPSGPSESSDDVIAKPTANDDELDSQLVLPEENKNSEISPFNQNAESTVYKKPINSDVTPNRGSVHYHTSGYQQQNTFRTNIADITTPKPKETSNLIKNPLDLIENEYDVTLNDALNPTIPNIPSRNSPSGFILQRENDYTFSSFQRPRYYNLEPLNQASSDFTYQIQQVNANNNRNLQPYHQQTQFLPATYHTTNYNTRQIRGHQQYTSNF